MGMLCFLENGIPDEDEIFERLSLDRDEYIPTIFLYYNDDLTQA
jgi:hypothetical protein